MRTINEKGRTLLIEREGLYLRPYLCSAKIATIGIGTTFYPSGKKVTLNDPPITEKQAYEYLDHELESKSMVIDGFCKENNIVLNDNQFSALLSFAYNLGCGPIIDKDRSMSQALISGSKKKIADAFMMYNKAKAGLFGRMIEVKGLTIRRKMEADLYFS